VNLRPLLAALVLAVLVWAAWSALDTGGERLASLAAETACRGKICEAESKTRHRTLFGWTFSFVTYGERTRAIGVVCGREYLVAGAWECFADESNSAVDVRFQKP